MAARLFQVTYEPKGLEDTGVEETVELFALNKEHAINIVRQGCRVGNILLATSQKDEFIPAKYLSLFYTYEDEL